MSGTINWMRYTTRVDDPALATLPVSNEHDGVGVAEAPELDTLYGRGFSPEQRKLIDQDELRVFDRYTPEFSFYCQETCVYSGPLGEAAVFRFLRRKPEVSRARFEAHLKGGHAHLCSEAAHALGVGRWSLNTTIAAPPPDFPFEVIDESWFPTIAQAAHALTSPRMVGIEEDLAEVCDLTRGITMLTRPTHRWPKTQP
jgi:hypothetical protein